MLRVRDAHATRQADVLRIRPRRAHHGCMDAAAHPRAWRIAAQALLGWNVLGGAVGGILVVVAVQLAPSDEPWVLAPRSPSLTVLVLGVALMLGAVGGLLGGGTLVLARGRRPSRATRVRGLAAGLVVCALVAAAALVAPIMPDATRPLALAIGLVIGAVMLGLAFRSSEVHWRPGEHGAHDDAPLGEGEDPIGALVDPGEQRPSPS